MHVVGFVPTHGDNPFSDDVRNGVEVSEHEGEVWEVARDVLGVIEAQGHRVHSVNKTTSLDGGWPIRVSALVTVFARNGQPYGRDMWHIFTEQRTSPWPRQWTPPGVTAT